MNSEITAQTQPGENTGQAVREWLTRFEPAAPLVLVPVFEAFDDTLDCLNSLFEHTPPQVPILLIDDGSTDPHLSQYFEPLSFKDRFAYLRKATNKGFVDSVNLGFELTAGDVVIINSDVVVPARWLERLRAAAYSGSTVATATPLTNHGGIISVPYRNQPTGELPEGFSLETIDQKIEESSLKLYPPLPAAVGHCIYFKRMALDLLGGFDLVFVPGYGEEVDFSQRAILLGLTNVLADDLFVYHKGSRSFNNQAARQRLRDAHDAIIEKRYPWYLASVGEAMGDTDAPLGLTLDRARAAILGYKIAIDVTCLDATYNGTQQATLELVRALAQAKAQGQDDRTSLTLVTRDDAAGACPPDLAKLVNEVVTVSELKKRPQPAFDLFHRPFQIYALEDLELLQQTSARFVITQLDSLAYAVPAYAPDPDWWDKVRRFTRLAFGAADGLIFISEEARKETARQGLEVTPDRSCVTYVGVDPRPEPLPAQPPAGADRLAGKPFLLMLGANFRHKNRLFGLHLFARLLERYNWDGNLVLAGPDKAKGGSATEEAGELKQNPQLSDRVVDLGPVTENEKQWLLENAALLLYPSTVEGFGMVPFEAAWANTPALTGRISALNEVLGEDVIYLESFEPAAAAQVAWKLLTGPELAGQQIAAIRARAGEFSWENVGRKTWEFYRQILGKAPHLSKTINRQLAQYTHLESEHRKLQSWSAELNQQLVTQEQKRPVARFKKLLKGLRLR
jgi:glycosyltransferase involved in cell wall biosynthesis/GT2 family glycosyltransferase